MKLVIFGLTVSSSWGNGHATLWRGLCGALAKRGHQIVFFERDVSYYAETRDLTALPGGGELILYSDWEDIFPVARKQLQSADAVMVTSYCPDAIAASALLLDSSVACRVFYDLDAPVTLSRLSRGEQVEYVGPRGYRDFDLVLSYTGGRTLNELRRVLGAVRVAPLYGSVDPAVHRPAPAQDRYRAVMSYMGTQAADREVPLQKLFVEPARNLPAKKFVLAGSQYDDTFPWLPNIFYLSHVPASEHPAFYCSSEVTLNVTRQAMVDMGYCPSGRLFEAAACGAAILSDSWEGLDQFYKPGSEILVAHSTEEAMDILARSREELSAIGRAARERTLAHHTADVRAEELENILEGADREANAACGA